MSIIINLFINKQKNILKKQDNYFKKFYSVYKREDYKYWSKFEMILCGIFWLIPRILIIWIILIVSIILVYLISFLFCITNFEKEQNPVFKWISRRIINISCRIILFCFGFWWIKREDKKTVEGNSIREVNNCKIIVSNHISFMDIFYILTMYKIPSIIAKDSIKNIPIVGRFAKIIQCIFLDRNSKDSKMGTINSLKKRIKDIKEGQKFSDILIFAEGTTNNGENLFKFKKGAFILEEKIKIMFFDYRGRRSFNPAYNLVNLGSCLLLQLLHIYSHLKVTYLDIVIDPNKFYNGIDNDWISISDYCREIISMYGKFNLSDGNYNDKFKAEVFLNQNLKNDN